MDEGLLNDLLECSVCLERLDTSSRVLPCQHTFCLKCLKVIVESHKELRCPECRVLVEAKVEELPPNVLLMRILEGMKNSAPRKLSAQRARSGHSQAQLQALRGESKQPLPYARAMYDYVSKELGDLSFKKGELIILQKKLDPFWYHGDCAGRTGMFPISYVQVMVPLPTPTALCKALYDFRMSAPDEEGCLAFDKGAIITVHRRVDENWAEGRLEQRVGIFPIAFVELNQAARQLMNTAPLNRPVPPLPDHTRAGHSEHRHHAQQQQHRYQPMSISTPTAGHGQGNYQNIATMSQSHPNANYVTTTASLAPQPAQHISTITHGGLVSTTAVPRSIVDPTQTKHSLDLIHFTNIHNKHQISTMAVQNVSRIGENYDRLRNAKFDSYTTPVQKVETTYQNVRTHEHFPVTSISFTNNSSDSSSSVNTPSAVVSSTTTPNTSSDTSTSESAEPSLPSSPDNVERNVLPTSNTQNAQNSETDSQEAQETSLNASLGVLNLNESSTATNTSLNVSLPPTESPKWNASGESNSLPNQLESPETSSNNEPSRLEVPVPTSSKNLRSSGPDSILTFGLGLQAALSPSHGKDGAYMARGHRDHHHREREKRHSLTPSTHLQGNHTQNRHSAEILATSLLDHATERERDRPERERERRRRRSRSNERPLPAAYIALYPYKPQKPDELELKKGGVYTVTERCRDGWYKGCCERVQRCGVFPGNYVAPLTPLAPLQPRIKHDKSVASTISASLKPTAVTSGGLGAGNATLAPPDAPPRATSPLITTVQPLTYPWNTPVPPQQGTPRSEKSKEKAKAEKSSISSGVSLMKRLAAMKKCKSPPPAYSMDNPVFDDGPSTSLLPAPAPATASASAHNMHHHVRSGSCPSQLLRALPAPLSAHGAHNAHNAHPAHAAQGAHNAHARAQRLHDHRSHSRSSAESGEWTGHRKSASLDVTARRDRHSQPVKEKFRCIVPYPPNSEYELELKVDDIVVVCKKRGDGWYKGTLQRTGRTGLFPASFVQSVHSVPPD